MSSEPKTRSTRYEPRIECGQDGLQSRRFNKTTIGDRRAIGVSAVLGLSDGARVAGFDGVRV
jgi:hypothetical protein